MITKTLKAGFFIIAIVSFSFAGAQEVVQAEKDTSKKMFKHLDINKDGKITLEEFKTKRIKDPSKTAQVEKRFASMDKNEDGHVDKAEFKVFFMGISEAKQKVKKSKG
ncbi:EF-hand domain-containing protein [Winogradskyella sp. R77965]|uniref:EF-hand domain-containing protein n=1 Tax=Winogradskyella sp. R77965 TaxID=3093872 RepID=UPI0037DC135F